MAVTAIDAPLGWPAAFVRSVSAYGLGGPFPDPGEDLWLRATDRVVWAAVGVAAAGAVPSLEAAGGRLSLTSTPGKNTLLSAILPAQRASAEPPKIDHPEG